MCERKNQIKSESFLKHSFSNKSTSLIPTFQNSIIAAGKSSSIMPVQYFQTTTTNPPAESETCSKSDSFTRIPDYLAEEILRHLSPEDKLRLECVSKQFQRTIFRAQKQLCIAPSRSNEWSRIKNIILKRYVGETNVKHRIDETLFDMIISKFRYIEDVCIAYNIDSDNMDQLIRSLVRHCIRIKRLKVNFYNISETVLDEFGSRFGQTLRCIQSNITGIGNKIPHSHTLLKHCSKLESLKSAEFLTDKIWNNSETQIQQFDHDDALKMLPNLKSCHLKATTEEGVNQLEQFSTHFRDNVEKLQVDLVDYIYRSHYVVNFIFPLGICKFRNLRECLLTVKFNGGDEDDFLWITSGLQGIADDCPKLEYLGIEFIGHQDFFINQVLKSMKSFVRLKRISISVSMYNKELCFPLIASVEQLDLAYPRLYQCTCLKNLIQSFPNVKQLSLNWMYFFNDVLLNSLIGMRKLQTLKIGAICPPDISTQGLKTFLNASKCVQSIVFDKKPKIDTKTAEMLIQFAENRPNVYFYFNLCLQKCEPEEQKEFEAFFRTVMLPKNIAIC